MTHTCIDEANVKMDKALDFVQNELNNIHTGKAHPSMVENLRVEAYGSSMKMNEVAAITTPDARLIRIQPFDKTIVPDVAKAIIDAGIGLNPVVESEYIRLPIPELSGDRRKELVKTTQGYGEEAKIRIRAGRKEAMDVLKADQKEGVISEDDAKRYEKEVQNITDKHTAKVDEMLKAKEADLMQM